MVPQLIGRPLFVPITTRDGTTVELQSNNVLKMIEDFATFAEENCTSLEEVEEAYAAAAAAASQAAGQKMPPWLVSASIGPKVSSSGTFQVQAGPLGYSTHPTDEQVGCFPD